MGDFFDQAQAIWKALDSMVEQDPDAYKNFITEQLEAGRNTFKNSKPSENGAAPCQTNSPGGLEGLFKNISLVDSNPRSRDFPAHSEPDKSKNFKQAPENISKVEKSSGKPSSANHGKKEVRTTTSKEQQCDDGNLLDDEITQHKSILANIVAKPEKEEESEIVITDLKLSTEQTTTGRRGKKPLIEEI